MPDSSPPSPAQRPDGQTVDEEAVRRRYDRFMGARVMSDPENFRLAGQLADELADTVPALLADLDAAREALRRAEEALAQTQRNAMTGWQLYRSEQADHNALKAVADKLAERAEDADEAEAERDRMRPVVEAARAWRDRYLFALGRPGEGHGVTAQSRELVTAVDTYETQENTER